jgi:hypothetical protein
MKPKNDAPAADESFEEEFVELVIAKSERDATADPARIEGVVVGRVTGILPTGLPEVTFDECPGVRLAARSIAPVSAEDVGRACALMFEGADPDKPILMGLMFSPSASASTSEPLPEPSVEQNGERVVFEAEKEIVLRCGKASITLTRTGKILIRGAYLLARSSGVNRIQGGSVQIN